MKSRERGNRALKWHGNIWKFTENFSNQSKIGSGANKAELQSAHIKQLNYIIKLAEHFYLALKTSGTLKEVNL